MVRRRSEDSIRALLEFYFPNLAGTDYQVTSPKTTRYNCIAWAAGKMMPYWWPTPGSFWPTGARREVTIPAFIEAFGCCGYKIANGFDLEPGREKIAIYAKYHIPTHAARQLEDGTWTSKLGDLEDIRHSGLDHISGDLYGYPYLAMSRPRQLAAA